MKTQKLFLKDFTLVVIGQIISLFGNATLRFALPLYLLRETESPALFGMVTAYSFIPMIVFSLFGGVIADRVNKRNIMVLLDFSAAALIIIFYGFLGKLPLVPLMIVVLMMLYGLAGAYQPAVQASIPLLVKSDMLIKGNAVITLVSTLAELLGPVIGGILFGAFGIKPILMVCIICLICSAVMEIFIRIPFKKSSDSCGIVAIVKGDLRESWQFVKNEKPAFIPVICILALFNMVLSAAMVVGIPVMIINILGMADAALGVTQGAMGLGGLLGGVLAGILGVRLKVRHSYVFLIVCAAATLLMGLSLLPYINSLFSYWIITIASIIAMGASTMFSLRMLTIVQQQTPIHLLGKIMATIIAVSSCAHPLGQAIYGVLFDVFESSPWIVLIGASVIAALISLYSKSAFVRLEDN